MRLPKSNWTVGDDPLLKIGLIMMTLAVALAVVALVLTMLLRSGSERAVASETTEESSAESLIRGKSSVEPWVEQAIPLPKPETRKSSNPEPSGGKPKPQSELTPETQLQTSARPKSQSTVPAQPRPESAQIKPQSAVAAQPRPDPKQTPEPEPNHLLSSESDWSKPTDEELKAANEPRHYELPSGAIMALSIKAMRIHNVPVFDSDSQWALANGIAHLPDTSLPWSSTPQRNVYLAGHRMGYRGTWSRMVFYNLDKLRNGDEITLRDRDGNRYTYKVIETLTVYPDDRWVTGQVKGRDLLTLQTCTPIPTWEKRLIVRAERI